MKFKVLSLLFLLTLLPVTTQNSFSQEKSGATQVADDQDRVSLADQEPTLHQRNVRYQLCFGDVLELNFPFTPEFNQTATVQPDGFITLRGIGDLQVAGKTKNELTERIQKSYSQILHDPVVTIELKDFEKPYFIVGGEVGRPGKFDLRGDTTVVQGIQIAGGFNEKAKHSQVLLFRRVSNNWVEVKTLDIKKMLSSADLTEEPHLRPGDMLFVPKNTVSKVKQYIPTVSVGIGINPWYQ